MHADAPPRDVDPLAAPLRELVQAFADAGHPIEAPVRARVQPGLPAVGTTVPDGEGYLVLVSDRAAEFGDVRMLLAHELGHVQRMASGHASHDDDAITAAYAAVELRTEHQHAVAHHVINHTQDLYADPLSLRIARSLGIVDDEALDAMILTFANDTPYEVNDPLERRWDRTEDMVGNARAIALARLAGLSSAQARAREAQRTYLARIEPDIAEHAAWFEARLLGLPEHVTRQAFTALLVDYLSRFVRVANGATR